MSHDIALVRLEAASPQHQPDMSARQRHEERTKETKELTAVRPEALCLSSLAAVNLSFSFRTPSPHDSLALKKIRAVSVEVRQEQS